MELAYYRPLSMTLTVLWDGERIGRIKATRRHTRLPKVVGTFFPDLDCATKAPLIKEAQSLLDAIGSAASPSEEEQAVERYVQTSREMARHVQLLELPLELEYVVVERGEIVIAAKKMRAVEYARLHPPRCIKELYHVLLSEPIPGMKQYGYVAYFRVGCPCGEQNTYLLGHFWEGEGPAPAKIFVSPLGLECPACGRVSELIDTRQHGWDGEQGCDCNMTGVGQRVRFPCPQCGEAPLQVMPAFSYQGNDYDPFNPRGRLEDMFGWFMLYAQCSRCGKLLSVTDFETA